MVLHWSTNFWMFADVSFATVDVDDEKKKSCPRETEHEKKWNCSVSSIGSWEIKRVCKAYLPRKPLNSVTVYTYVHEAWVTEKEDIAHTKTHSLKSSRGKFTFSCFIESFAFHEIIRVFVWLEMKYRVYTSRCQPPDGDFGGRNFRLTLSSQISRLTRKSEFNFVSGQTKATRLAYRYTFSSSSWCAALVSFRAKYEQEILRKIFYDENNS